MLQYPGFNPVAIELGPIKVHWYGIMYLIGFAAAWWLGRIRASRPGSSWKPLDVYGMEYWARDPWYPLKVWEGGMSFHGALLGTLVALAAYAWRRKRRIADVFDFGAPLPEVGLFFGRIGNFINGELWGKQTTVPWGFRVDGQVRHASQLYEAGLEGLLVFTVVWIYTRKPRPGLAPSGLFLLLYGLARFSIEFVRVPDANLGYLIGGWVTMGQILSLPMILGGVILLVYAYRRHAPSGNFLV